MGTTIKVKCVFVELRGVEIDTVCECAAENGDHCRILNTWTLEGCDSRRVLSQETVPKKARGYQGSLNNGSHKASAKNLYRSEALNPKEVRPI